MSFPDPENPIPAEETAGQSSEPAPQSTSTAEASPTSEAAAPESPLTMPASTVPPKEDLDVPPDLRTPWGWGELAGFAAFAFVSLIVMEIIVEVYLATRYHMDFDQIKQELTSSAPLAVGFQLVWSVVLLVFLFLIIRLVHHRKFWSTLSWRKIHSPILGTAPTVLLCILGGVALAVLVSVLSSFAGSKTELPIQQLFQSRENVLWLAAYGTLFAPMWEETMFRGYLYPLLARKLGIPSGILLTGLLFGLMHALQLWGGWIQIGMLIFVGIVLTWARARSGSVVASYLIHLAYNTLLFSSFYFGTQGLTKFPPIH